MSPSPHTVKVDRWYNSGDHPEAFRQLVRRADHRFTDGFLPERYEESCEYRWITGMVDMHLYSGELHYAVEVEGKTVGCVNVTRLPGTSSHTGQLRLTLLPEACGQGIGTQVVAQVLKNAKPTFHRIQASIFGPDIAAQRVLEKNGFTLEGTRPNALCKDGNTYPEKIFGIVFPPNNPDEELEPYLITKSSARTRMADKSEVESASPQPRPTIDHWQKADLTLRPWQADHAQQYTDLISRADFSYDDESYRLTDVEQARRELEYRQQYMANKGDLYCAVLLQGEVVGSVQMVRTEGVSICDGAISCLLAKEATVRGIGTEALRQLIALAWERQGLTRLTAEVWGPNLASARMAQKLGFCLEATLHHNVFKNGHYLNSHLYGLLPF